MSSPKGRWAALIAACCLMGWMSACGPGPGRSSGPLPRVSNSAPAKAAKGGTLLVALARDPVSLDPLEATSIESAQIASVLFDTLVRRDHQGRLHPGLALRWERSRDGRTWTFHLRPGVLFHDGTPADAEAVRANLQRQAVQGHQPGITDEVFDPRTLAGDAALLAAVDVLDATTVRVRLARPVADFPRRLSALTTGLVSPAAVKKWKNDAGKHPVGTGPYRLAEWRSGDRLVLEANEKFWNGRPPLDRLLFMPLDNLPAGARQLERGSVDALLAVGPADAPVLKRHKNLSVDALAGRAVVTLFLNATDGWCRSPQVRLAIAYALDRRSLIRDRYKKRASPAPVWIGSPLAPRLVEYAPAKARRLAQAAGALQPAPLLLLAPAASSPVLPDPAGVASAVAKDLAAAGLPVKVDREEWPDYVQKIDDGEYDVALGIRMPVGGLGNASGLRLSDCIHIPLLQPVMTVASTRAVRGLVAAPDWLVDVRGLWLSP